MSAATITRAEEAAEAEYWDVEEMGEDPAAAAQPLIERVSSSRLNASISESRLQFSLLADELESAMLGAGSTRRVSRHPAYAELVDMGDSAIPYLLERVREPGVRPLWLRLLSALTPFPPGAGCETISDAAAAWIQWGSVRGYANSRRR
ncbi:MAG TPA: hypothetical protein VGW75_05500 [Solirubrobacteraceae bacterium]|nr:hypothetical protein [Solirubrobacteraceae bacterium]